MRGILSLENVPQELLSDRYIHCDAEFTKASDGRIWINIDGFCFIRFKPESAIDLSKELDLAKHKLAGLMLIVPVEVLRQFKDKMQDIASAKINLNDIVEINKLTDDIETAYAEHLLNKRK